MHIHLIQDGKRISLQFFFLFTILCTPFLKACKKGQFDVVELMLNNQVKAYSINFAQNQPVKIGLGEIEKL